MLQLLGDGPFANECYVDEKKKVKEEKANVVEGHL